VSEQHDQDELSRASAAFARRLKGVDASLDDRVMAQVRRPAKRETRVLHFPRALFVPLAAAALLLVWLAGVKTGERRAGGQPAIAAAPANDTVYVRFELRDEQASAVHLAGDFSDWRPDAIPLVRAGDGTWSVTLPLSIGQHHYQFVVDGQRWVPDPAAGAVDDGFGGRNSVIVVGPKGVVRS
jgi:hypothetical protein